MEKTGKAGDGGFFKIMTGSSSTWFWGDWSVICLKDLSWVAMCLDSSTVGEVGQNLTGIPVVKLLRCCTGLRG